MKVKSEKTESISGSEMEKERGINEGEVKEEPMDVDREDGRLMEPSDNTKKETEEVVDLPDVSLKSEIELC